MACENKNLEAPSESAEKLVSVLAVSVLWEDSAYEDESGDIIRWSSLGSKESIYTHNKNEASIEFLSRASCRLQEL